MIGSGTMGIGMAKRLLATGYRLAFFVRSEEKGRKLSGILGEESCRFYTSYNELFEYIKSKQSSAVVLISVPKNEVARVLSSIQPFVSGEDIVIDTGNTHFNLAASHADIIQPASFCDVGVSGGRYVSDVGASLMAGGIIASDRCRKVLESIAYRSATQSSLIFVNGPVGSGHFVKSLHNFIEYGVMQAIAEIVLLCKEIYGMNDNNIAEQLQSQTLDSPLLQRITTEILCNSDDVGNVGLWNIIARCTANGTANWIASYAIEHGLPCFGGIDAVMFRVATQITKGKEMPSLQSKKAESPRELFFVEAWIRFAMVFMFLQARVIYNHKVDQGVSFVDIIKAWRYGSILSGGLDAIIEDLTKYEDLKDMIDSHMAIIQQVKEMLRLSHSRVILPFWNSVYEISEIIYKASCSEQVAQIIQAQRHEFGGHPL